MELCTGAGSLLTRLKASKVQSESRKPDLRSGKATGDETRKGGINSALLRTLSSVEGGLNSKQRDVVRGVSKPAETCESSSLGEILGESLRSN